MTRSKITALSWIFSFFDDSKYFLFRLKITFVQPNLNFCAENFPDFRFNLWKIAKPQFNSYFCCIIPIFKLVLSDFKIAGAAGVFYQMIFLASLSKNIKCNLILQFTSSNNRLLFFPKPFYFYHFLIPFPRIWNKLWFESLWFMRYNQAKSSLSWAEKNVLTDRKWLWSSSA